jgi:predicted PurR-regulated permease PerM
MLALPSAQAWVAMRETFHKTSIVLAAIVLWAAVGAFLYAAREMLIVVVISIIFAYVLEPVVARFERLLKTRVRAIAATYAVLLTALVIFFATAGPHFAVEAKKLGQAAPEMFSKLENGQIAVQLGNQHGWSYETQERLREFLVRHHNEMVQWVQGAAGQAAVIAGKAAWIVIIPILAIFLLRDKWSFMSSAVTLTDETRQRRFVRNVLVDIDRMLARYIRAQLLVTLLAIIAYVTFLLIIGFPYGSVIGMIGGMLEFIPFVGPLITAAVIMVTAFVTGYKHWVIVLIFLGVWRLIQDYVNTPRIMGKGLELHPLLAIIAILAGGEIGGVLGMFLAIPVVATLRILWRNGESIWGENQPLPAPKRMGDRVA